MCTQKQDTRFSWMYWKKNWKQLFDWDFLNIHWWECLLYSEYIFLGLQCYFLIAPEPWSFDIKIRAIRPMVRWRKIEDYLKKREQTSSGHCAQFHFQVSVLLLFCHLVSSDIIWYHLVSSGIWYHHLSIVWCLRMVDSCCPSNVKSVKKFCEYRISEILRFSLFDTLIFCKNSSNGFLLLCKKVQQTNIMTSLYPLPPSAPSSDWATSEKTNPQQAQSYSERVCDGWPWMWSDDRMHWTRISSSLTLKA